MHPRLLTSLVLIDPVIEIPTARPKDTAATQLTRLSTFRRDWWPSREKAAASFRNHPFYKSWDERVLNRWLDIGFREVPTALYPATENESKDRPVTLLTSKHQEVFTFLRPNFDGLDKDGRPVLDRSNRPDMDLESGETHPFYRAEPPSTFKKLPYLRPPVLYIFAGTSDLSAPELREQRMTTTGVGVGGSGGAAEGRVKQFLFPNAGHLMPMEIPNETAEATVDWLAPELEIWRKQEREFQARWSSMSKLQKQTISEEWKRKIMDNPSAPPSKSQL
ncbi:MAG: hypothetical protein Q9222_001049 [Ikaeria aurantiellina]